MKADFGNDKAGTQYPGRSSRPRHGLSSSPQPPPWLLTQSSQKNWFTSQLQLLSTTHKSDDRGNPHCTIHLQIQFDFRSRRSGQWKSKNPETIKVIERLTLSQKNPQIAD